MTDARIRPAGEVTNDIVGAAWDRGWGGAFHKTPCTEIIQQDRLELVVAIARWADKEHGKAVGYAILREFGGTDES